MKTIAIIGGGLAAGSLAYYLKQMKDHSFRVELYHSEDFAPSCSLRSTAVAAQRGVQRGFSPLGDQLSEGFLHLCDFVEQNKPQGVECAFHYQLWSEDYERVDISRQRFSDNRQWSQDNCFFLNSTPLQGQQEPCFIFYPKSFLDFLLRDQNIHRVDSLIKGFKNKSGVIEIYDHTNRCFQADALVNASSIYAKTLPNGFHRLCAVKNSKLVAGSYWQAYCDHFTESFSATINGVNVIYRSQLKQIQIASYSFKEAMQVCPDERALFAAYQRVKVFLAPGLLAPFENGKILTGWRQKGVKRMAFAGRLEEIPDFPVYGLHSLYKNGYTLSLYLAQALANRMAADSLHW